MGRRTTRCAQGVLAALLGLDPGGWIAVTVVDFGDIDVTACKTAFEFGKDGKPLFVSGPHHTSARCNLILAALEKHCGPKGFHYVLAGCRFRRGKLQLLKLQDRRMALDAIWP